MGKKIDLTGRIFGDLQVLRQGTFVKDRYHWICKCTCGVEKQIRGTDLQNGKTVSCGCKKYLITSEKLKTHGMTKSRPWNIWVGMKQRCESKSNSSYKDYGARGISVCDHWGKFENFWNDMGPSYKDGFSIDRINVDSGYNKENCRWIPLREQSGTRRISKEWNFHKPESEMGAYFHKASGKYISTIFVGGIRKYLGLFNTKEEANMAWIAARNKRDSQR